jgi:outer membrane protein assembly factor BamB
MNHGISRTVPAVTDQFIVTIGPKCHVMCAETETGKFLWGIDLQKDYGTKEPLWYTSQCPIIDGTTAIIAPGGKDVLIMGVDCATGKVLWKTPNPKGWQMSHSSVIPYELAGKKMYLYCAPQGIIGVATDGSGKVLFESTDWAANVVAPVPVFIEGGHLYLTTGYGVGSMMLKLEPDGEGFKSKVVWKKGVKDGVACEQQTPIYYEKHLYSLHPADGGANKDQLVCVNPMEPDKILWTSGKGKRFGHYEPFLIADGKIYVLSEAGVLTVVRATPEKYEQLAEFKVLQGRDAWAPIAMAGGRMLLRDSKKMVCLNVAKGIE